MLQVDFALLSILAFVALFVSTVAFLAKRYRRCPSDKILVIYGKIAGNQAAKCIHGGGTLVWPLIQDYSYLSLTPMTMSIPLENALSLQNIRIHVPSTFTVGISINPLIMANAAERLLGLASTSIEGMAREIIFGQLRLTVASLTIEQINQDREKFLSEIRKNVEPELNKIGLYLINVNITDISDESEYIDNIGKKAVSEALNRANVDVAEQRKIGAIGQAAANREKEIKVAQNEAMSAKGKKQADSEQRVFVQMQEAEAIKGENKAKAEIAKVNAELAKQEAAALKESEIAKRNAEAAIEKARYQAEFQRLSAEEVVKKEIERQKVALTAEASAEKIRIEARAKAEAVLMEYEAEAKGIGQVLASKAKGYESLVKSCAGDSKAAATLLLIEKMEQLVQAQVEAVKNLKIDKITVWDSGNNEKGSATANFVSSIAKSLPPIQDIASMAGIEMPEFLGKLKNTTQEKIQKADATPKMQNGDSRTQEEETLS